MQDAFLRLVFYVKNIDTNEKFTLIIQKNIEY